MTRYEKTRCESNVVSTTLAVNIIIDIIVLNNSLIILTVGYINSSILLLIIYPLVKTLAISIIIF